MGRTQPWICLLLAATLLGCTARGPRSIKQQRGSYIDALATTDKQELLSNIVRLAYADPPVFLQVNSVTASPSVEYGSELEARFGGGSVPPPIATLTPRIVYTDSPTIVYMPLLGREFASELLVPFDLRSVFLMLDNGFSFSVVWPLTIKFMNGLSSARDATPQERAEFQRATDALARMIGRGEARIGTSEAGLTPDQQTLVLSIQPGALAAGDGQALAQALDLDPLGQEFSIRQGLAGGGTTIAVRSRSMLSLLSLLSNYVDVPDQHDTIAWPSMAGDDADAPMHVFSTPSRPSRGDPAICYKGQWFYTDAEDLRSRNTLFLVRLLFNLQAQTTADSAGVQLTLPVR